MYDPGLGLKTEKDTSGKLKKYEKVLSLVKNIVSTSFLSFACCISVMFSLNKTGNQVKTKKSL